MGLVVGGSKGEAWHEVDEHTAAQTGRGRVDCLLANSVDKNRSQKCQLCARYTSPLATVYCAVMLSVSAKAA